MSDLVLPMGATMRTTRAQSRSTDKYDMDSNEACTPIPPITILQFIDLYSFALIDR